MEIKDYFGIGVIIASSITAVYQTVDKQEQQDLSIEQVKNIANFYSELCK